MSIGSHKRSSGTNVTPPLLSLAEASRQAGVSLKTIRRRIESGELEATRIGVQIRIDPHEFERFLGAKPVHPVRPPGRSKGDGKGWSARKRDGAR